ncbi:hypothetical protein EAO28_23290 [Klebsiella pneumoniae]|uniref:Uncharacterized protein n=1 Tax=Klebsiella pneumoniae TaxID=573 RepID=A0A3P2EHS4_KLEPN|nr:hypothetical protein EAO28_23290 [Klebsiella pneumoniae]
MAASETIYGVHENQSVKRSGQAGGAVRASKLNVQINLKNQNFLSLGMLMCATWRHRQVPNLLLFYSTCTINTYRLVP